MDMSKTVYGVIGLVVAIVLISALAIPVMDDVALEKVTKSNIYDGVGYEYSDSVNIEFDSTAKTYTVNDGDAIPMASVNSVVLLDLNAYLYVSDDVNSFRYRASGEIATVSLSGDWTATLSSGTVTVTNASNSYTAEAAGVLHIDPTGSLLMNDRSALEYNTNKGADMYVLYPQSSGFYFGAGTVGDCTISNGTSTYDITAEITSNGDDSVKIGEASYTTSTYTNVVTYFIPIEYEAFEEGKSSMALLMSIIPLLLIISVVMGAVKLIGGRE